LAGVGVDLAGVDLAGVGVDLAGGFTGGEGVEPSTSSHVIVPSTASVLPRFLIAVKYSKSTRNPDLEFFEQQPSQSLLPQVSAIVAINDLPFFVNFIFITSYLST